MVGKRDRAGAMERYAAAAGAKERPNQGTRRSERRCKISFGHRKAGEASDTRRLRGNRVGTLVRLVSVGLVLVAPASPGAGALIAPALGADPCAGDAPGVFRRGLHPLDRRDGATSPLRVKDRQRPPPGLTGRNQGTFLDLNRTIRV